MSGKFLNHFENLREARMRLNGTIVLYDGEPYYVLCLTQHKSDGIIRLYLDKMGTGGLLACSKYNIPSSTPSPYSDNDEQDEDVEENYNTGPKMDKFMEQYPDSGVIRKKINSPRFNRFRPFELGMCNVPDYGVFYLERRPVRCTSQGMPTNGYLQHPITLTGQNTGGYIEWTYGFFADTLKGVYPSFEDAFEAMFDSSVLNKAVAFNRNFALLKGPFKTVYLAYRTDVVGLVGADKSVSLGHDFKYLKEVTEELGVFSEVKGS